VVVNDNGGTATPGNFTMTANGGSAGTLSGAGPNVDSAATFKAGTYALSLVLVKAGGNPQNLADWLSNFPSISFIVR